MKDDPRTLVIQPLPGIGDMIWHVPYLRALAHHSPLKKISLLTKKSVQANELLGHETFVDTCFALETFSDSGKSFKTVSLASFLRAQHFTHVYVWHHSPRYAFASWLGGIPHRWGYGWGYQRLFLNTGTVLPSSFKKQGPRERAQAFLTLNQIPYAESDQLLTPSPQNLAYIAQKYASLAKPWVILGIGASQPFKCWPPESFAALAHFIKGHLKGSLFLLCSPSEVALGQDILKRLSSLGTTATMVSELSLDQVLAFLSQGIFYVGNCSGPLNLSASVGVPSFGLFGATDVLTYSPFIFPLVPSPSKASLGMRGLDPQDVWEKIQEKLTF